MSYLYIEKIGINQMSYSYIEKMLLFDLLDIISIVKNKQLNINPYAYFGALHGLKEINGWDYILIRDLEIKNIIPLGQTIQFKFDFADNDIAIEFNLLYQRIDMLTKEKFT